MSFSKIGEKHPAARICLINGNRYGCVKEAMKNLKISRWFITKYLEDSNNKNFQYI